MLRPGWQAAPVTLRVRQSQPPSVCVAGGCLAEFGHVRTCYSTQTAS